MMKPWPGHYAMPDRASIFDSFATGGTSSPQQLVSKGVASAILFFVCNMITRTSITGNVGGNQSPLSSHCPHPLLWAQPRRARLVNCRRLCSLFRGGNMDFGLIGVRRNRLFILFARGAAPRQRQKARRKQFRIAVHAGKSAVA